jgi:hypothetical protein
MNSGFNDDLDWASAATPGSGFSPTNFGATTNVSKISGGAAINEEFFDDFDDDDDAFFSSAIGGGASAGVLTGGSMKIDTTSSAVEGARGGTSAQSSFGMMTLSYSDASVALVTPNKGRTLSTSTTQGQGDADNSGEDDISDDLELLSLDQKYLSQLRDPNSSFRAVARSCLVCQQLTQSPNNSDQDASALLSLENPIRIQSTSVYHIQRYQRLIHRVVSSLTTCLSTHTSSVCKSLAASTLASTARASYARLHFDAQIFSVRLPPSVATRLEDECGNGVAHTLMIAAIEQGDDAVSSASFEALGILTLDSNSDALAAEVRGIVCNTNHTVFTTETGFGNTESAHEMREMQSKIWDNILFPRMQRILHRISLYSSCHNLAKAIPVVTATFVHALTQGLDTTPARRALQCGKSAHAKRAWVESDAERLVAEFVDRILLPCFVQQRSKMADASVQHAAAVACIRLSSVCPVARWRVPACRNAVLTLSRQLDEMISPASQTIASQSVPASANVAVETLSGLAAILLVALRGVPVTERTPGLASVLRATLLSNSPVGLLTEIALSVMLDGSKDIGPSAIEVDHHAASEGKERIIGTRSKLLNRIFLDNNLPTSLGSHTVGCELVWVFCAVFQQIGVKHNHAMMRDMSAAADWSNIGLVLLDNFASVVGAGELHSNSPLAAAATEAYSKLLAAMLKLATGFPPASLSISENMFIVAEEESSIGDISNTVVGVPGESSSRLALTLFKLTHALTFKRSTFYANQNTANTSLESMKLNIQLNATLCDAWLGQCIANNDAKQSNKEQLDIAFELLSLCRSDMMMLLQTISEGIEKEHFTLALHLIRVSIACVATVACASEVISYGINGKTNHLPEDEADNKVGAAAISALNGVFTAVKEISQQLATSFKQGAGLCAAVAEDSNNAASHISGFMRGIGQYYHEDIVTALQPSNFPSYTSLRMPPVKPNETQASSLYQQARLGLDHRTNLAIDAYSSTTTSMLFSKSIRPFNPLRMNHTFSQTSIQVHQLVRELPLLIPERTNNEANVISLAGSSDPVSLLMSTSMRQTRASDSGECMALVVTMRLHNITAVPLRNGVRLDVAFNEEGDNSACTTSLYRSEIEAGDYITWEIILGSWVIGELSVRATMTFLGIEKETLTHKWLHGGGEPADDVSDESPLVAGDDFEGTMDVTIPCEPTTISTLFTLQPCPLVFYRGASGDVEAFDSYWCQLEHTSEIRFTAPTPQQDPAIDVRKGHVTLPSDGITGCAFITPSGDRILCKHQRSVDGPHCLFIKSNSSELMSSLLGTLSLKTSFLRFVFGENVTIMKDGSTKMSAMKHDFPSMTMKHSPINAAVV